MGEGYSRRLPQAPTLAVSPAKVLFRFRGIGEFHLLGFPFQFLASPVGDVAQVVGLGQWPCVGEMAKWFRAFPFACAEPFGLLPGGRVDPRLGGVVFLPSGSKTYFP